MSSAAHRCFFEPDAEGARRLDARMRERLGESLAYVMERAAPLLAAPPGLDDFLARLARGPVDPQAFGAYYDLVLAIEADDLAQAKAHLDDLVRAPARTRTGGPRIVPFEPPESATRWDRYLRQVDTDPDAPITIVPPDPRSAEATRERIAAAFALLDRGHPELAAEIRALVGEIVLAESGGPEGGLAFAGVASFMLWGGIVINATSHPTVIEMAEALAHEAAHALLFGFSTDGPLVENDDDERYDSPLRRDARPVDGIYHATFVLARMHHALHRLRAAGVLDAEQARYVDAALEDDAKRFVDGLAVIERHGRLTPDGVQMLAGARAWMAEASGIAV